MTLQLGAVPARAFKCCLPSAGLCKKRSFVQKYFRLISAKKSGPATACQLSGTQHFTSNFMTFFHPTLYSLAGEAYILETKGNQLLNADMRKGVKMSPSHADIISTVPNTFSCGLPARLPTTFIGCILLLLLPRRALSLPLPSLSPSPIPEDGSPLSTQK